MRRLVGGLALLWAAANLGLGYLFLANAFVAKTAAKEGILAQASLLIGGLLIGVFSLMLAWQCYRLIVGAERAAR